ncbi:MAG: nitrogenase iron-molybdenum cofactor biosynthesis protein NifN [Microcystaceae cyanobacterium]
MTTILKNKKSAAVNPLKQSQPFGAALAFLGLKKVVPLFHGSQGCTAFAKVLLVRHFRESIPLATTAMTEVATILGGEENIEQAIFTLVEKANPEMMCLLTTGLTETRGDDMKGIIKSFRKNHPELNYLPIIFVSTPDYQGAMQDGYQAAVEAIVSTEYGEFVDQAASDDSVPPLPFTKPQVTILTGSALSPGDVAEIKEIVQEFGLNPLVLPDLSQSVDGHLEEEFQATTSGGTSLQELQQLDNSIFTLAIGESMRHSAEILEERFGTKYEIFPRLAGLEATDQFIWQLSQIMSSLQDPHFPPSSFIPPKYQHQRRQLQDAILDTHFYFGRKKISLALEPDLLYQTCWLLKEMGAEVQAAVTTTKSPLLNDLPVENVTIGDLEDLEDLAAGSDLIITNSHGKQVSHRLGVPLYRMGYPIFDRLGNGLRCFVGYRGTMQFLFDVGNILLEEEAAHEFHFEL